LAGQSSAATIRVPGDYPTIGEAISAALGGDTILVDKGTYAERLYLSKPVTLAGADPNETFIYASGGEATVIVDATSATVRGFTIVNDDALSLVIRDSRNCIVSENVVVGGMAIVGSTGCVVSGNRFEPYVSSRPGLTVTLSDGVQVIDNAFLGCPTGIYLDRCTHGYLRGNKMSGCELGLSIESLSGHDIDTSNEVDGKPVHYFENMNGLDIGPEKYPEIGYLAVVHSDNVHIHDISISNSGEGINLEYCQNVEIRNVTLTHNDKAIRLDYSPSARIENCTLIDNNFGILSSLSDGAKVQGNFIDGGGSLSSGIYCQACSFWTIKRNVLTRNYMNLRLYTCEFFVITENDITDATEGPPSWSPGSGIEMWDCGHNRIYHNNWIRNPRQAAAIRGSPNTWNAAKQIGGNFWDDYRGSDLDGDGIGDSPYYIDSTNVDYYPLMEYYAWQPIDIDDTRVSDRRCDVNSTQLVMFHATWSLTHQPVRGCDIYVNGTPCKTNETGWAALAVSSSEVGLKRWNVTKVIYYSAVKYRLLTEYPSIIWDSVNISLTPLGNRVGVGETGLTWSGTYCFDHQPFAGEIFLNDTALKLDPGRYGYSVSSISDPKFGLTSFRASPVSVVFDRVKVTLRTPRTRVGVGTVVRIGYTAVYEYSGDQFNGTVEYNSTLSSPTVGAEESRVWSIVDPEYGITQFRGNVVRVVFDRIHVVLHGGRVDVGCLSPVNWTGWYEYDRMPFKGTVELDPSPGSDCVQCVHYSVKGVRDPLFNISSFVARGASVVYDRVRINITALDRRIDVGKEAQLRVDARYEYDGRPFLGYLVIQATGDLNQSCESDPFEGMILIDESGATLDAPGSASFSVSSIHDSLYGLRTFLCNGTKVTWDTVLITLTPEDERIDVGTCGKMHIEAVYQFDGKPFSGSILLNDTLRKFEVGRYGFSVANISDPLYGLETFEANEVGLIFDKIVVNLSIADSRIDVSDTAEIRWEARYQYDGQPFTGEVKLNGSLSCTTVGQVWYTVSSVADPLYGISSFSSNKVACIFDRVKVKIIPRAERVNTGSDGIVSVRAWYEYDGSEFNGSVALNQTGKAPDRPCKMGFCVSAIEDYLYGLRAFSSEPVSVVVDKVHVDLQVEDNRIDVGTQARLHVRAFYMYDLTPFSGTVRLNDTTFTQARVGKRGYAVAAVSDDLYGLTEFESKPVSVIFDRVEVRIAPLLNRTGVGRNVTLRVDSRYAYDGEPLVGSVELNRPTKLTSVGKVVYRAAAVEDDLYGLSTFSTNEAVVIFDKIQSSVKIDTSRIGRLVVTARLRFESDGSCVTGALVAVEGIKAKDLGGGIYVASVRTLRMRTRLHTYVEKKGFDRVVIEAEVRCWANTAVIVSLGVVVAAATVWILYFLGKRK